VAREMEAGIGHEVHRHAVELVLTSADVGDVTTLVETVSAELEQLRPAYDAAVHSRGRTTVGASDLATDELVPYIAAFVSGEKPPSPRAGVPPIPLLKLVVEDLQAFYTEARTHRDQVDDLELTGQWFWEETEAGHLLLLLEAVALESDDRVLRQIADMSLITPRFWSEGPLPGSSGSAW
ncbi:MAG: hypothetical protein AAF513_19660, partial [Pseudomonadota bacterium]